MPRTGRFGGFDFDPEVFSEFMSENPTWNDAIIASGVLAQDNTIMDLIGENEISQQFHSIHRLMNRTHRL